MVVSSSSAGNSELMTLQPARLPHEVSESFFIRLVIVQCLENSKVKEERLNGGLLAKGLALLDDLVLPNPVILYRRSLPHICLHICKNIEVQ